MGKKIIIVSLTIFFLSLVLFPVNAEKTELKLVNTYGGGKLYKAGKINVVVLHGTYRQMGRQYGKLLGREMELMYEEVIKEVKTSKISKSPEKKLSNFAWRFFSMYPQRLKEIAYGISETSGLTGGKVAVLDNFMGFFQISVLGPPTYCSQMVVWGEYTKGKQLIAGRNFEYLSFFRKFSKYITIVVYNPTDGSNSVAVINYAGQITGINYFNATGLVMAVNEGSLEGVRNIPFDRLSPVANNIQFTFDYSSLKAFDAAIKTNRLPYPLIYVLSTPVRAYCYELTPDNVKRREGTKDGLLVATNHFLSPLWKKKPMTVDQSGETSVKRYKNLVALANKQKGKITVHKMMEILDLPLEKGGVTDINGKVPTMCQFVAVPKDLKIYVKALDFQDWTEINLKNLFVKTKPK